MENNIPATVGQNAPATIKIERKGQKTVPIVPHLPQVRGGVCDHCGILDPNVPSEFQYKLCPHYRGVELRCSYCDDTKDPVEVNRKTILSVAHHPEKDEWVVWCNTYECS